MALEKTRNDIINFALEQIGAKAPGEEASAADVQTAAQMLDYMVKQWQSSGAHLWSKEQVTLFLDPSTVRYTLGASAVSHATVDPIETTMNTAAVETATVLDVVSETGMTIGDNLGVIREDNSVLFWSTIASLAPLTIADPLPSDVAAGATVYTYTDKAAKPLKVPASRRSINGQDIQMVTSGYEDYQNLPNKLTTGTPTQYTYQPRKSDGYLYIWPAPVNSLVSLKFTSNRPLDVFDTSESAPDFPNEWLEAIMWNLAYKISPAFGKPISEIVQNNAFGTYEAALSWDSGDAPVLFEYAMGRGQ